MKRAISNLPFLHSTDGIYESTSNSNFRAIDSASISVNRPKLSDLVMMKTNYKMYDCKCEQFKTTSSAHRVLPMTTSKILRPITSVKTSFAKGQLPEPTYNSSYSKHEISPITRQKNQTKTGVSSTLRQEKKDQFDSMYCDHFQCSGCPRPLAPIESIEKQRIQYSSIPMGDQEKILERASVYYTSFGQSDAVSPAKVKKSLLANIKKNRPLNLQEVDENEYKTKSAEEFYPHEYGPVDKVKVNRNLSYVLKGEKLQGKQAKLSTTNQTFFPEISFPDQFPLHVDGSDIRNLSNVHFGRANLAGQFYSTSSQEHFIPKEVIRPKPPSYPPAHVLKEQEPEQMMTTAQSDFDTLKARRQELSQDHLQRI